MKLADVTPSSGGLPVWNFDASGLPSTIEEAHSGDGGVASDDTNVNLKGEDACCNGYDQSPSSTAMANTNRMVPINNGCNNDESQHQTSPTTASSTLANSSGTAEHQASPAASLASGGTGASQDTRKCDPVFEISGNLKVKIADLGNACWVVSTSCYIFCTRDKVFAFLIAFLIDIS